MTKPKRKRRVPDAKVATERMSQRTPLRLTSEDEAIMREDWLLDPHKLPQVRIYQELLHMQRENGTLRAQVSERDERIREMEEGIESRPYLNERGLVTVGRPRDQAAEPKATDQDELRRALYVKASQDLMNRAMAMLRSALGE